MENGEEKAVGKKRKKVVIGVIVATLGLFIFFGFRNGGLFRSKEAVIPDVRKMSYEDAEAKIRKALRKAGIRDAEIYMGWTDAGREYEMVVASQTPKAGTVVHKGESVAVYLYVGEGWYTKKPHWITYEFEEGIEECFTQMPASAYAGDTVELRTHVLMDAGFRVYVNGTEIEMSHYDSDYWGYTFTMGMYDTTVTVKWSSGKSG